MDYAPVRLLLVEADPSVAGPIREALAAPGDGQFRVTWVTGLADALAGLRAKDFEAVLLDLTLPDGQGLEAFDQVFGAARNAVILILSSADDEQAAHEAVRRGAYDHVPKGPVDAHWLPRAVRYAIADKAARDALRNSEARFRAMSDASPLGIFVSDSQARCVYTNAAYQKISGLSYEEALGTNWGRAIHPEDRRRVLSEWRAAARSRAPFNTEFRFRRGDGSVVWTRVNSAAMGHGTEPHGHVQTVEDITERKSTEAVLREAEEALFAEKERAQVTLNSIGDAVLTTDLQGRVTYLNVVAETMTGWSQGEALGRPVAEVFPIVDGATGKIAVSPTQRAIAEDRIVGLAADSVLVRRDGSESAIEDSAAPIHGREGRVAGAVMVFHDVSQSRAMAQKMSHLAQHDALTGLPNRSLLTERISRAIGLAHRHGKQVGVLFLDLDHFKHINDSLGHATGDMLLQSVAARLMGCVRATDTVCRQGGDEFVILLSEIEHAEDAARVAEAVNAGFAVPHSIGEHQLHVTLSIGIGVYPDDGGDADALVQCADTAMYHAKTAGRNNYQFYTTEMNARAVRRMSVQAKVRRALERREFLLHYQPQVDLASGALTGAEALIRWLDPDLGLVYPAQFVPIAEECGLIVPIGQWALREACAQVRSWQKSALPAVPVAVNISALELRHKGFLEGLTLILKQTGLTPGCLELELTEGGLMHDIPNSATVLQDLSGLGVRLAIDDFGMGYSSLSYLKRFPIHTLKIDQSFVRDIATDADDANIVRTMIEMGANLRQRVIAEGVETREQLTFLRSRHWSHGQGFYFSRPLCAEDFASLLADGTHALPTQWPLHPESGLGA